jgi:16S rRNA (uracil1498-N3)-methyltransferase
MDLIIRQAVETGVERIVPVASEHAIPRFNADMYKKKRERWLRVARQAMQQCGRKTVPEIESPVTISQLPIMWREHSGQGDLCLLFHEKPVSDDNLHRVLSSGPRSVGICIGPEGGFSHQEVADLLNSGLQPVYINTNVLRTETAALYAIAAVQTVILEKDSWNIHR